MKICVECYHIGKETSKLAGTMRAEFVFVTGIIAFGLMGFFLPLFWLISAGLFVFVFIYSIYRRAGTKKVCPKCKKESMLPLDSTRGQQIIKENNLDVAET